MAPSVSYSITVRLEVASRGRAVSEITRAVEHTGGVVTALDVTSGGNERLRVDVTCAARDTAHAEAIVAAAGRDRRRDRAQGQRPDVPAAPGRQDRDALQGAAAQPGRPVHGVHPGRRPGRHGHRGEPGRRAPADHQAELRGGGDRRLGRAGPGQHRALRRAARHGGQGRAVQAVRRHRRLADLPGQPGHRRDRPGGAAHRARLRRDQPGGHQRAALLRGRAPPARTARHPGVPRRPARHRDRGHGRADQRAARGGQEAPRGPHRDGRGRAPPGPPCSSCCSAPAPPR